MFREILPLLLVFFYKRLKENTMNYCAGYEAVISRTYNNFVPSHNVNSRDDVLLSVKFLANFCSHNVPV